MSTPVNRRPAAPSQGRLADMDGDLLNRSDTYLGLWQEKPQEKPATR